MKSLKKQIIFSILIFLLFILGGFLKEPWHDELYTREVIKKPFFEILKELKKDNYPPLYYYIAHFFCLPFNFSIFSIRLLSAIFVLISLFFILKILNFLKIKEDFLVFLIFLFPVPFYFSSEARAYSLILLLSSIFFLEILTKKRPLFLSIIFILLGYTHYLSLFYFSFLVFLFIIQKDKKYLLSLILPMFGLMPLFFLFKIQPKESLIWASASLDLRAPINFFSNLGPNIFENYVYNFYPLIPPFLFFIINLAILIYEGKKKDFLIISLPFFFNFLIIFAISFIYKNIYTPSRTETFFFIPFSVFLLSFFKNDLKYINFIKIFYFLITLLSLILIIWNFSRGLKINEEIMEITNFVQKDTKICVIGYWKLTFLYELEKKGMKNEVFTFPFSQDVHQGWYYVEEIDKGDISWFSEKILKSKDPWLLLWDKNNPIAKKIVPPFLEKSKIYETQHFYFALKN